MWLKFIIDEDDHFHTQDPSVWVTVEVEYGVRMAFAAVAKNHDALMVNLTS